MLAHDDKLLIIADGGYLAFVDATRLESHEGDPVLGYMATGVPVGFIYAHVTADDRYLFAAAERGAAVRVTADGRMLFVTNFASRTLEMIDDLARVPLATSG